MKLLRLLDFNLEKKCKVKEEAGYIVLKRVLLGSKRGLFGYGCKESIRQNKKMYINNNEAYEDKCKENQEIRRDLKYT